MPAPSNPLVLTLLQILVQDGPAAYAAAVDLAHHPDPQRADFLALAKAVSQESYDAFIQAARDARVGAQQPATPQPSGGSA